MYVYIYTIYVYEKWRITEHLPKTKWKEWNQCILTVRYTEYMHLASADSLIRPVIVKLFNWAKRCLNRIFLTDLNQVTKLKPLTELVIKS